MNSDVKSRYKSFQLILFGALLIAHLSISLAATRNQSLTYDEPNHYRYGEQILHLDSDRFDDSKMPFSVLNVIPLKILEAIGVSQVQQAWQPERLGRISTILFSTFIAFVIGLWAREWYGRTAGLLALALYAFDPNIIAHAGLITTDIYAAGMISLALLAGWWYSRQADFTRLFIFSLTLGIAQLAKYTAIFLYPILFVCFLPLIAKRVRLTRGSLFRGAAHASIIIAISLLIINVGFLLNNTMMPLGQYDFQSDLFTAIKDQFRFLGDAPVPVPYPYLQGLDLVRYRDRAGVGYGAIYLLGETHSRGQGGFAGYYIVASLLKRPLGAQVLLWMSVVIYFARGKWKRFLDQEIFVVVPLIFLFIYMNFMLDAQIGIRLYLVVYPLVIMFTAILAERWDQSGWLYKGGILVCVASILLSVASYFPHYIPYFNELIVDRKEAYKYLADSNIDFGQAEAYLEDYLNENPEAVVEPDEPTAGTIVVSVNRLTGVRGGEQRYAWLRSRFEPTNHIAYAYLVYEIE